jgi:hypothetical protein
MGSQTWVVGEQKRSVCHFDLRSRFERVAISFCDAATAVDPSARELDEGRRFPICLPSPLAELFQDAGLHDVEVRHVDIATKFRDFDDYWLVSILGWARCSSSFTISLSEERREALREANSIEPSGCAEQIDSSCPRAGAVRGPGQNYLFKIEGARVLDLTEKRIEQRILSGWRG